MAVTDSACRGHGCSLVNACAITERAVPATDRERSDARPTLEQVFREHYPFVRRMLRYWGVPPPVLEDAAQDVFVVVTRRFEELVEHDGLRSWLLGVCRRVARNHRRSSLRFKLRHAILRQRVRIDAHTATPSRVDQHEEAQLALQLLESLPEKLREVLLLCELEGWTAPEVAEALGLKLNTVYSRLRLARRRIEATHRALVDAEGRR